MIQSLIREKTNTETCRRTQTKVHKDCSQRHTCIHLQMYACTDTIKQTNSGVPARLGKGQGAKEIGHNLAREQPKFWHNLVHKRHIIGHSLEREWPSQFYTWTTKIWSQSSTRTKWGLGTILWAIDENMGTNLQAFYKHFYIGCLKTQKQQLYFVKKKAL